MRKCVIRLFQSSLKKKWNEKMCDKLFQFSVQNGMRKSVINYFIFQLKKLMCKFGINYFES